jgi:polyhydroxyalkanoate synthesis regulator phasin
MTTTPALPKVTTPPEPVDGSASRDATGLAALREAWKAVLGTNVTADEETQALVTRLVTLGRITREEGARVFEEVKGLVETRRAEVEERLHATVQSALGRHGTARSDALALVVERLTDLERRVSSLDGPPAEPPPVPGAPQPRRGGSTAGR